MYPRTFAGTQEGGSGGASDSLGTLRQVLANHCARFYGRHVLQMPETASLELVRTLALGVQKSLKQIVPLSSAGRSEDSFVQRMCREVAARRRVVVQRIYVLTPDAIDDDAIDGRLDADRRDALQTRLVSAAATPADLPLRNTWLVDDALVVHEDFADDGSPIWTVDSRSEAVERSRTQWDQLWDARPQGAAAASSHGVPKDPLLVSADLIASMAPMSCASTPDEPDSCSWYHGVWQYLRLLDMVPEPGWHADFFADAIGAALLRHQGTGAPRALISGCADYALLGETLRAAGNILADLEQEQRRSARVAVLDRCRTPLVACQWYARQSNTDVDLYEMDIRNAPERLPGERFDVIVSDTFLTKFSAAEALDVLRAWRRLLVPGGRAVTTVRLRSTEVGDDEPIDEVLGFASQVRARAERWRWLLRTTLDDLVRDAERYARRVRSTNLGSPTAIDRMFKECGFKVLDATTHRAPGALQPTDYLRIVASAD